MNPSFKSHILDIAHIATARWCHSAHPLRCISISDFYVLVLIAKRAHYELHDLSKPYNPGSGMIAFAIEASLLTCCSLSQDYKTLFP